MQKQAGEAPAGGIAIFDGLQERMQKHEKPEIKRLRLGFATVRDILRDTLRNYQINGDTNQAAAIALYAILSIIPLFILTILMASLVFGSNPQIQQQLVQGAQGVSPYLSQSLLEQLGQIDQKRQILGWVGIISLVWFSAMIFNAIETVLNTIFRSHVRRSYVLSKLLAVALILLGWIIIGASVGLAYVWSLLARQPLLMERFAYLPLLHGVLFRYILPYAITVAFFTVVYKATPTARVSWGAALMGSLLFSALMEVAKHFFAWYVANYTRYHVIFGGLEAVVVLVIWVFYVAMILLFCAELIASYQRRDILLLEKALLKPGKARPSVDERLLRRFGRVYPKGSFVFREGDTGSEMYYILQGRILVQKQAGQIKKVLTDMGPGEYFGEMATLIDAPRTASAEAASDSCLAVIDSETFHRMLRESDDVSMFMLQASSRRIKHTNEVLEELTEAWIELMAILYFLKEWPLARGQDPVTELVRYTGKDPEDIREVLHNLGREGILRFEGDRVMEFVRSEAWKLLNHQVFG